MRTALSDSGELSTPTPEESLVRDDLVGEELVPDDCLRFSPQQLVSRCDDGNPCTMDYCIEGLGCVHSPRNCNDGDPCTRDSCNRFTGGCTHGQIPGCGEDLCDEGPIPLASLESPPGGPGLPLCDDANACTRDECIPSTGCIHTPRNCNDSNACTNDSCNPLTGCSHAPRTCSDSNACTTDGCNPTTGCTFTPRNCNDGNACTNDSCNPLTGCSHAPRTCNDGNACTTDGCNPATGCTSTPRNCNDGNACTIDGCHPVYGCTRTPRTCNDGNACTNDGCNPATGCTSTPRNCNDSNACTNDSCNPSTGCVNTPRSCNDGNACTIDSCNRLTGCSHTPRDCDDGNECTIDSCNPATGACVHTPRNCGTSTECELFGCNPLIGCYSFVRECDDGDLCTVDNCDPVDGCCSHYSWVECGENESCDSISGDCMEDSDLVPCIAIIDEDSNLLGSQVQALWAQFRTTYPSRPFCLLVPAEWSHGTLTPPSNFLADVQDPNLQVVYEKDLARDEGDPNLAEDWFSLCNLGSLTPANVPFVAVFLDDSGSLTAGHVQASLNKFDASLTAAGLQKQTVVDGNENWILPFLTTLAPPP